MKKFMSKLESKLEGNRPQQQQSSARPASYGQPQQQQQQQHYYNQQQQYAQPPGPPPQQQQYTSANSYQQQQPMPVGGAYAHPPGPPPAVMQQQGYGAGAQQARPGVEDPFAVLRRYDTVFVVDDSESMEMFWDETREALVGVVEKSVQYDEDGIDIYFFNSPVVVQNLRTAQDVRGLFRRVEPRRSTPTATALKKVVEPYLLKLEAAHRAKETGGAVQTVKPLSIIVLTDGAPNRGEEPEGVIVNAGKRLDTIRAPLTQLGFQFIQIGSDEEAQEALTYLDDHIKTEHGIRDMVDTMLFPTDGHINSEYLLKGLIGGISRKVDRQ